MVHATVKNERNGSFTVTFGEAQINGANVTKSANPSSSKSASTGNLKKISVVPVAAEKALVAAGKTAAKDPVAAAKAAVAAGKKAVVLADRATYTKTELTTKVSNDMANAGRKAYHAASDMLRAMLQLRDLQVRPAAMQGYITTIMYASRQMRGGNTIQQFTDLKNEFREAMIGYGELINTLENTVSVPVAASGTSATKGHVNATQLQKAEAEFNQIVETVKNASQDLSIKDIEHANNLKKNLFRTYNQVQLALDAGSNTNKQTATKEKMTEGEDALILIYNKLYAVPKKMGGSRTHRKRTPQKHRKRTHRNPRKRSLTVFRR
jgi:hypothetical protein